MPITGYVLLSLMLLGGTASPGAAQTADCDTTQFGSMTNLWKPEPDQNTTAVAAAELAAERTVMQRVLLMFRSAFVPTGAIGLYSANYDLHDHARFNTARYGNTYTFVLSNQKIECHRGKPAALDVSLGNVSVQVNVELIGEASRTDPAIGYNFLPRGYYQRKEAVDLPQANEEGVHEFNFADGTTVWWLTRAGVLPFRVVTQREFLQKQLEILRAKAPVDTKRVAYYERLAGDATDVAAVVKDVEVPSLNGYGFVFTTLADRASRVYVTVNPEYYDRRQPRSAPQHILIRLKQDSAFLKRIDNGPTHLESMGKLRDIVRANLAELRAMVK